MATPRLEWNSILFAAVLAILTTATHAGVLLFDVQVNPRTD
jgi:hypothetical protein